MKLYNFIMRRNKKNLTIDEDSLQRILDECYHETNDLKIEISNVYSIWNTKITDIGEIAAIGKDIIKLLDQRDKVIDKKLKVAQQLHAVITERNKTELAQLTLSKKTEEIVEEIEPGVLSDELSFKIDEMIAAARNGKK